MKQKSPIAIMTFSLCTSLVLMGLKFFAWTITGSGAILSDALESVINIVAGAFALYSVWYSSRPKDEDHPYGHGKIEYLSAGFEGALIFFAGALMIFIGIKGFIEPPKIDETLTGAILAVACGAGNFFLGRFLILSGRRHDSPVMIADGKHLQTDTWSSVGLITGLVLIHFTGFIWIDSIMAIVFGLMIFLEGFRIVRDSVNNLIDKADEGKLNDLVEILNQRRKQEWIDIHNLRVLKFGPRMHVDAHVTLPYYLNLEQSHNLVVELENAVRDSVGKEVEFFIHSDPCLPPESCSICSVANCPFRKSPQMRQLPWSLKTLLPDYKHHLHD